MKWLREKLALIRVAISELRYVVQETLLLITKLALLMGALSAPVQLVLNYFDRYTECPPQPAPHGAQGDGSNRPHRAGVDRAATEHERFEPMERSGETQEETSDAGINAAARDCQEIPLLHHDGEE